MMVTIWSKVSAISDFIMKPVIIPYKQMLGLLMTWGCDGVLHIQKLMLVKTLEFCTFLSPLCCVLESYLFVHKQLKVLLFNLPCVSSFPFTLTVAISLK